MEALLPVLQGKVPVLARAHRVDDILTAVRLADEFKLKLIISHGTEAYKVADLLAAKHIPWWSVRSPCSRSGSKRSAPSTTTPPASIAPVS